MPKQILILIITLSAFWLLLSGYYYKINLLVLGVLSIILVIFLSLRMQVHIHKNQPLYFPILSILRYWYWLFIEIMKSNVAVAKMIISPKLPIKPMLKIVYAKQETEIGRVIYANSITLTPGTVATNVSLNKGIIVHALHQDSIAELEEGAMHNNVIQLEKTIFVGSSPANAINSSNVTNKGNKS